jgi:para-aminobenzoate synthetase component 1
MTAPFVRAIPYRDPLAAFAPLAATPMAVLLDSALPGHRGRYSYVAADPVSVIRAGPAPWPVWVDGARTADDPFAALARALAPWRVDGGDLPVPFGGGAIGVLAYELGGVLERLPAPRGIMFGADMVFGIYDVVAAFDHDARAAWIIAHGAEAESRAAQFVRRLGDEPLPPEPGATGTVWQRETPRADYERMVRAAIALIQAGDIFQANLTQRFFAAPPPGLDWFGLYRRLRTRAAGPFGAFFHAGAFRLLSASPERFLSLAADGRVETRPIKGTRPRDPDPLRDRMLARDLVRSDKDRAENLMIVDLLRNDLARVCVPGSIAVPALHSLETFPAVHHLVSAVTGTLRPGLTAVDLLRACFPGGSVTGAPKIRAMEVIRDLEAGPRGPYCGALAWLGFDGAMDSSIVIRSLVGDDARIYAQAGGGIVADSDPALEYAESLTKVAPLLAALSDAAPP